MRYCRFQDASGSHYGLVEARTGGDFITRTLPLPEDPQSFADGAAIPPLPLSSVRLLAPVQPSKVICVGRNYRDHAKELGNEPPTSLLIFMKPPSAVIAPGANIVRPKVSQRVDHEGELGVVIGHQCRAVKDAEDVRRFIRGYTIVNDVTARDLQKTDDQWTRAKGFDTFCPVGPLVSDELDPWSGVELRTRLNGEPRQQGNTRDFIFSLDAIIRYVSGIMTLLPGDLIATGTPAGVGPMKAGDKVEVSIAGIGSLVNPVVDE